MNRAESATALLIGLDKIDLAHYGSDCANLLSAEKDVHDYELIARLNGFEVQSSIGNNATRSRLLNGISKAAKSLKAGDFFLLTFSGFGGIIANFGSKERQQVSPTWCVFDGQMLITEVLHALAGFKNDVNVLVISDCSSVQNTLSFQQTYELNNPGYKRALPLELAETIYLKNKDYYDGIYLGTKGTPAISANVIWISACQVNQVAYETFFNGYLTAAIKHIWNGGAFKENYEVFFREVSLSLPPFQSPFLLTYGEKNSEFIAKTPFTI